MAVKEKQNTYRMLQLYAKDVYAYTRYDENGNKNNSIYNIYLTKKDDKAVLSNSFKGSMNENLDLIKLCNKYGHRNIIKKLGNDYYIDAFVSISFKGKSKEYTPRKDYSDNKLIYVKRGFQDFQEILDCLNKTNDAVYEKNGVIIAVKVEKEIENENKDVTDLKYFKIEEKEGKKYYVFTNSSVGDIKSERLRQELYNNGFSIRLDGNVINYKRYKRSASNARVGKCLFIREEYFGYMDSWSNFMFKSFKYDDIVLSKPVEAEAYKALSLSSLKNKIELDPKNILILKDVYSVFNEECINVDINNDGKLVAKKEITPIKNNIWDGEGLLDKSVFDENGYSGKGMLLLRNQYFKCCAFNTNLQKWFKENNINSVSQLNGYTRAQNIEDIKLVVTESSIKILKFSDSHKEEYKDLAEIRDNLDNFVESFWMSRTGSIFGVVKTDEPTHRFNGRVVKTSYQVLNTLGMNEDEVKELIEPSLNYLIGMKNNSSILKYYIDNEKDDDNAFEYVHNDSETDDDNDEIDIDEINDIVDEFNGYKYKICSELLRINPDFEKTKLYSEFRTDIISNIKKNFKKGKLLIPGTFTTIFGNGYELLLATINKFDIDNTKPLLGNGEVMCGRLPFDTEICGARFPHVTMGNLYLAKNIDVEEYNKWFNLSKEIICVNAIKENIQQKLNGMDYDSDTMLVTDFKPIVDSVKKNYDKFLVPVSSANSQSVKDTRLFKIDHNIANNYIGRIINLSQHLNSILWDIFNKENRVDEDIYLNICKLAILSGMEIDKAKRDYNVDSLKEFNEIKNTIKNTNYGISPKFRERLDKEANKKYKIVKEYSDYKTTMDYIAKEKFDTGGRTTKKVKLSKILNKNNIKQSNTKVYKKKASEIKDLLESTYSKIDKIQTFYDLKQNDEHENKSKNTREKNRKIREELNSFYSNALKLIKHPYTIKLFLEMNVDETHLWPLLYALYISSPTKNNVDVYQNLLEELFINNKSIKKLTEDDNGNINLFGFKYKEELITR